MKNLAKITVMALAAIAFTFASCTSQPADKTSPDDMVEGADAGLDTVNIPSAGDTTAVD